MKYRIFWFFVLSIASLAHAECKWDSTAIPIHGALFDKEVKTQFVFSNVGDLPIIIDKVTPSCGCTAFTLSKKVVYPGEKGTIDLAIQTDNHVGQFIKNVSVVMNDDNKTVKTMLLIIIDIPSPLLISPAALQWSKIESMQHKKVHVTLQGNTPVHIISIESSHKSLESSIVPDADGKGYEIEIWPTDTSKRINGTLILHTDLKTPGPEKRFEIDALVE